MRLMTLHSIQVRAGSCRALRTSAGARHTAVRMDVRCQQPAPPESKHVAVIGAGAAGLVAAKVLLEEGHTVVLLEQGPRVGGVWDYTEKVDADVTGLDESAPRVHSSMYRNLRTNLPRPLMAYPDLPFHPAWMNGHSEDPRTFPGHAEVQAYLLAYCERWGLAKHVRANTRVERVDPLESIHEKGRATAEGGPQNGERSPDASVGSANGDGQLANGATCDDLLRDEGRELQNGHEEGPLLSGRVGRVADLSGSLGPRWRVSFSCGSDAQVESEEFDAVVNCNGHYSIPNVPFIPGREEWPGQQMHSHSYRDNTPFAGKTVVVLGVSASGEDISREIAEVAAKVFLCGRDPHWPSDTVPYGSHNNIYRRPTLHSLNRDGSVTFRNGWEARGVDCVLYATGYRYQFPFLEHTGLLRIENNTIHDLYGHVFLTSVGASLSFIGIPWRIVPFPQFELQARWIARCLSGQVTLPPREDMEETLRRREQELAAQGLPASMTHYLGDGQWEYNDWLARVAGPGVMPLPSWRAEMYDTVGKWKRGHPQDYRDSWRDLKTEAAAEEWLK